MKTWLLSLLSVLSLLEPLTNAAPTASSNTVFILPIRDVIAQPLVYLVRRGV